MLCIIPDSVSSKMFVVRAFNHHKTMLYSFYLLIICILLYVFISLGAYHVDAKEKKLPTGSGTTKVNQDIYKRKSPLENEPPEAQAMQIADDQQPIKAHQGRVNMHVFEDCCGGSLDQLKNNLLYPLFPNVRTTVSRLAVSPQSSNYGLRIFGYLHPSETEEFIFAVASDDNSEFWLSLNENPENLQLLAYVGNEWTAPGEYWKFASQISKPILLVKDMKYFFEVVLKQNDGIDHLEIAWSLNHDNGTFSVITSEFLSLYEDESSLQMGNIEHIPQTKASYDRLLEPIPLSPHPVGENIGEDPRDHIYKYKMLDESYLKDVFPQCHYKPSYILAEQIGRYQGVNLIHFSSVYPNDYTRQTHGLDDVMCFYTQDPSFQADKGLAAYLTEVEDPDAQKIDTGEGPFWQRVYDVKPLNAASKQTTVVANSCRTAGNIVMSQDHAMHIVRAFLKALRSREETRDYSLLRVVNVVRREDKGVGSRYLVELELVGPHGQKVLVSRYVYALTEESSEQMFLCSPKAFNWNPSATVHIIVAVKDQARWIIQFIREMEKVYRATGDKNFNVIIIDYNSSDMDIEKRLKKAKLPSYKFKRMEGNFQRSAGLQAGIDLVEDEHSILFLCDLHLYYPVNIINSIRRHCIEGKMVYAPVVLRLDCGASPRAPNGLWEIAGYGLMGIYKSDMDRIGGMNTREFTDKWGGEDWELLDRVLGNGLEVERLHLRNFFHQFHSKRGMWVNNNPG
ncbi:beta-1,4-N-acetylgalactosaminyltransferase 3 isoform X2 [Rhinichthys klamathensis goyatoka]|uniref:beta-1,4-N-acetylgalactosaminyltransferase 3 isoform X2 n=1 Tax=Rhinichthys klamathensis goyatoka TaxID=3034132 RepID=UPI0024B62917|nr:beta-1,4-N-acetylgalactosaminyltransferase 3 isoform X2 [Rhinichthys klamathensis goyatoka]